jgi:hypothetical protein
MHLLTLLLLVFGQKTSIVAFFQRRCYLDLLGWLVGLDCIKLAGRRPPHFILPSSMGLSDLLLGKLGRWTRIIIYTYDQHHITISSSR